MEIKNKKWISISNANRSPSVKEVHSTTDFASSRERVVVEYRMSGFDKLCYGTNDDAWDLLRVPEAGCILTPGHPCLPREGIYIELPDSATRVIVRSAIFKTEDFAERYNVLPSPLPRLRGYRGKDNPFVKDKTIYGLNSFFPTHEYEAKGVRTLLGKKVAVITISPIQYNPVQGKIRLIKEGRFELEVECDRQELRHSSDSVLHSTIIRSGVRSSSPSAHRSNHGVYGFRELLERGCDYLILYSDSEKSFCEPFFDYAGSQFATGIISVEEIARRFPANELPDSIIRFVRECVSTLPSRPTFLGILGDARKIPPKVVQCQMPSDLHTDIATDHLYSSFTSDTLPDMVVGRIPASTPEEFRAVFSAVEKYSQSQSGTCNRSLIYADSDDGFFEFENECDEVARIVSHFSNPEKYYRDRTSSSKMVDALKDSSLLVAYHGHGHETGWDNFLNTQDVKNLPQPSLSPLVIAHSCLTSRIDDSKKCIGDEWLTSGHAIGYVGGTRPIWGGPNNPEPLLVYDALSKGMIKAGEALTYQKIFMLQHFDEPFVIDNQMAFIYLGFPGLELAIRSQRNKNTEQEESFNNQTMPMQISMKQVERLSSEALEGIGKQFVERAYTELRTAQRILFQDKVIYRKKLSKHVETILRKYSNALIQPAVKLAFLIAGSSGLISITLKIFQQLSLLPNWLDTPLSVISIIYLISPYLLDRKLAVAVNTRNSIDLPGNYVLDYVLVPCTEKKRAFEDGESDVIILVAAIRERRKNGVPYAANMLSDAIEIIKMQKQNRFVFKDDPKIYAIVYSATGWNGSLVENEKICTILSWFDEDSGQLNFDRHPKAKALDSADWCINGKPIANEDKTFFLIFDYIFVEKVLPSVVDKIKQHLSNKEFHLSDALELFSKERAEGNITVHIIYKAFQEINKDPCSLYRLSFGEGGCFLELKPR